MVVNNYKYWHNSNSLQYSYQSIKIIQLITNQNISLIKLQDYYVILVYMLSALLKQGFLAVEQTDFNNNLYCNRNTLEEQYTASNTCYN